MHSEVERFAFEVCRASFLSLWSYHGPLGKGGKEPCDILVVCDPHVVIISVKNVRYKDTGRPDIDRMRWQREAIDESAEQIYGAERWTKNAARVVRGDGEEGLPLPPVAGRRVHRVAVAYGSQGQVPLKFGDFGKGFVHVLDG